MRETIFTDTGVDRLAEIAKRVRGTKTLKQWEDMTEIPISTTRRLEECNPPDAATLRRLAPHTSHTFFELLAIGMEVENTPIRDWRIAEDLFPYAEQLPKKEIGRLICLLAAKLAEE